MKNLNNKRNEFVKLHKAGFYTQKQIAEKIGISQQTACEWKKDLPEIQLIEVQKRLVRELQRLTKEKPLNAIAINKVISAMERLKKSHKIRQIKIIALKSVN